MQLIRIGFALLGIVAVGSWGLMSAISVATWNRLKRFKRNVVDEIFKEHEFL